MKRDRMGSWTVRAYAGATCLQFVLLGSAQAAEPAPVTAAPPTVAAPSTAPTTAPQMLPPPAPPPGPVPTSAPVMAPPPAPAAGPVPVSAPEMLPPPPLPAPPPAPPAIGYTFGIRAGLRLQDPGRPKQLGQIELDSAYAPAVEARFHGAVTDQFSWVADFNAVLIGGTLAPAGSVGVEDLIAKYKAADEFQIWAGRLLVPSDRSNFCGPFFMIPWNYPGFYVAGAPLGPKDGPNGRDQGVTVWGNALDAKLKYYVGAYGLDQLGGAGSQPYYSGRVSYSIQGSEPGYFGSSTYYGAKSVATIGVGAQYQKSGSEVVKTETAAACPGGPNCKDTFTFMLDGLVEEATSVGTFTFEGQYYKFTDGYVFAGAAPNLVYAPEDGFYFLAAYLLPKPINLQPMVRVQQTIDPAWTIFDAALAYVIKDYSARIIANYEHIDRGTSITTIAPNPVQNSIQLGIQLQSL